MRNAGRLSGFDREDMKLVRTDYGTRVLYYVDASAAEGLNAALSAAIDAVRAGTFDGVALASASSVDESVVKTLADALGQTDCLLIFEGTPLLVSEAQRSVFDYYIVDVSAAADDYDLEMAINHALNWGVSAERLMLGSVHGRTVTDNDKTVHSSLNRAAYFAQNAGSLAGVGIYDVGTDYYNSDIICKQTRGLIQQLNPAKGK